MEEGTSIARVPPPPSLSAAPPPPPAPPPASSSSSAAMPSSLSGGGRQRFSLELKPGETTIVSWKKLVRDSSKAAAAASVAAAPAPPTSAHPAFESPVGPQQSQPSEVEMKDAPPSNRFSAVIEKIERLYTGNSDEEELDDIPDDDQYDTEDSFIDDAELDEYFQVEKTTTKHSGFFVNRGKLEHVDPGSSTDQPSRKRRRKESTKAHQEIDGGKHAQNKPINLGNVQIKAAARNTSLVAPKPSGSSKLLSKASHPLVDHYEERKSLKKLSSASTGHPPKKSDFVKHENSQSFKMLNRDASPRPTEVNDVEGQKSSAFQSRDSASKLKLSSEIDATQHAYRDKVVPLAGSQSRKATIDSREMVASAKYPHGKNGVCESPDMYTSGNTYHSQILKSTSAVSREAATVRPKGTIFERAIRDLEKIVAESRPSNLDVQETDVSSQGVKRRLPQDVKQKLAKVARLASSQGKISEGLIDRLMGILGHRVQRKTLKEITVLRNGVDLFCLRGIKSQILLSVWEIFGKRNLKEMIELGLSAKQHKDDKFQQIKKEVTEMIKATVPSSTSKVARQQDSSSVDFQQFNANEEKSKEKYSMDKAMEDKICDLYDLYVEGMDEDKGPQVRKLYVELAELWPNGCMDNHGIKGAVYRAKERKRALYNAHKVREKERLKRRKMCAAARTEGTTNSSSQVNLTTTDQTFPATDKLTGNQTFTASAKTSNIFSSLNGTSPHHPTKNEKLSSGGTMVLLDTAKADVPIKKKYVKRKSESDLGENHSHNKHHKSAIAASSKSSLQSPGHQVVSNIVDM
ncbi:hypothetical protein QJS04_geneDACA023276 [Acorus gramineus]|uniref:Hpc2-related domain-containing protein n=1 Tax=Acorus gramineus TaxID=55184 RepID=A0AAV9BJ66_ACOGR|nr:hypothetical protein QJS04_geneDACA023276 [Acorus gramineus]